MTWSQKLISVTVALAQNSGVNQPLSISPGTIAGAGSSVTLNNLRASVRVYNAGAPVNCSALIKVWGMTPALMNQLATLGIAFNILPLNLITVMAGDTLTGLSTVFQGTIRSAYGDYEAQPDVPMTFAALSGTGSSLAASPATNFQGSQSVVNMMQTMASALGLQFENNGVSNTLRDEYVEGTLYDQAAAIADHAGIGWAIIGGTTLSIWSQGGSAASLTTIPTVSPSTGMIGYPGYTQQGVVVKTAFNSAIQYGGQINLQSSLQAEGLNISGNYTVNKIDHALDSLVRNGQWMSTLFAYNPNYARTTLPPATGSAL